MEQRNNNSWQDQKQTKMNKNVKPYQDTFANNPEELQQIQLSEQNEQQEIDDQSQDENVQKRSYKEEEEKHNNLSVLESSQEQSQNVGVYSQQNVQPVLGSQLSQQQTSLDQTKTLKQKIYETQNQQYFDRKILIKRVKGKIFICTCEHNSQAKIEDVLAKNGIDINQRQWSDYDNDTRMMINYGIIMQLINQNLGSEPMLSCYPFDKEDKEQILIKMMGLKDSSQLNFSQAFETSAYQEHAIKLCELKFEQRVKAQYILHYLIRKQWLEVFTESFNFMYDQFQATLKRYEQQYKFHKQNQKYYIEKSKLHEIQAAKHFFNDFITILNLDIDKKTSAEKITRKTSQEFIPYFKKLLKLQKQVLRLPRQTDDYPHQHRLYEAQITQVVECEKIDISYLKEMDIDNQIEFGLEQKKEDKNQNYTKKSQSNSQASNHGKIQSHKSIFDSLPNDSSEDSEDNQQFEESNQ